jgi:hypothetical protein
MTTGMKWLTVTSLAWVLWMDQTVYKIERDGNVGGLETARGQFVQLAVVATKRECQALRRDRIQDAKPRDEVARRDAAKRRRGHYPEQHRFFCSPAVNDPSK